MKDPSNKALRKTAEACVRGLYEFALMYPFARARTQLARAHVRRALGRRSAARRCARSALKQSRAYRLPHAEGHALMLLAELEPEGRSRRELRAGAEQRLRSIGAFGDLARLDARLPS